MSIWSILCAVSYFFYAGFWLGLSLALRAIWSQAPSLPMCNTCGMGTVLSFVLTFGQVRLFQFRSAFVELMHRNCGQNAQVKNIWLWKQNMLLSDWWDLNRWNFIRWVGANISDVFWHVWWPTMAPMWRNICWNINWFENTKVGNGALGVARIRRNRLTVRIWICSKKKAIRIFQFGKANGPAFSFSGGPYQPDVSVNAWRQQSGSWN